MRRSILAGLLLASCGSSTDAALPPSADVHEEGPCRTCGGQGWITVAEHGCDGDEELCVELCPVPAQAQCPECAQREPEASGAEPW